MLVVIVLFTAVALQLAATVLALRLIRITGRPWAWGLIAGAIILMVTRRCLSLMASAGWWQQEDLWVELVALAVSAAMAGGLAAITPLFRTIRRSNAILRAIRNINQAINRETDCQRLLQAICTSLVESEAYRHAWIGTCNAERWELAAEAGLDEGFQAIRDRLAKGEPTECVRAALDNPAVTLVRDMAARCGSCPQAAQCRDSRVAIARLAYGQELFGLIVAALPRKTPASPEERALIEELAGDIGTAMHNIRLDESRARMEAELRLDESRLEAVLRLHQMSHAPLRQITDFALEEAVRLTQSHIGYLAFVSADEAVLTMHSWSHTAMDQCRIIDKPIVYPVRETGLWGEAVRQRRPIITNDYAAPSPWKKGYPAGHVEVRRHVNVPVFDGERIVIVAGVGNKAQDYDESDIRQLTLLMQGMWQLLRRKEAEEGVRDARDKLEVRVEERTAQLAAANAELSKTADELRAATLAAEAANRSKSTFLANMSHEIRTPLNAIIGMTELVLKSPLNAQQREFLATVRDSGEALLSVINDILDFSRIEAGKLMLSRSPFNLWENLGDTMKSFALRAHQQGLELAYSVHPDVPYVVVGDYNRLRQVLVNLVANSLKFTESGEVVLEVACEAVEPTEVVLHFTVSDTGIGIPADKQAAVFEMFEQADSSIKRRHGGTGLGLAIASRLVDLMGGKIWVESEIGRGSRFHFTVRLGLPSEPAPARFSVVPAALHGLPVLIVDDNATNRRILQETLRGWHMEPTAARSAAEAMGLLRDAKRDGHSFRLVLTDAHMPAVDGFALVEQIRNERARDDVVIMMLTSGDHPEDAARCRQLGIAAYLLKPVKQSELLEAISMSLGVASPLAAADDDADSAPRVHLSGLKILVAEDSIINQRLAVALLEGQAHRVTVVHNGCEAIRAVQQESFDLILMDVQMPEMDGLEATAAIRLRERQTGGHMPIIAMTAHALKGDREMCLDAGMDAYIAKPIQAQDLFDTMDSLLRAVKPREDPIDWNAALAGLQGNTQGLRAMVEAAIDELSHLLEAIRRAVVQGDAVHLRANVHTLKGSLRYFGAARAFEHAQELELVAKEGPLDTAPPILAALETDLAAVHAAMRAYLQNP